MSLVNAKCTGCGAFLKVDDTKDASICEHCHAPFIVSMAIERYNAESEPVLSSAEDGSFDIRDGVLIKYTCPPAALASPVIPRTVTKIGDGAFQYAMLLSGVTIPDTVGEIGDEAFSGCAILKSITIPGSVKRIGKKAFSNCASLADVTIPGSVQSIGERAFGGTAISSLTLPEGVKEIGDGAFWGCRKLKSVSLPASVSSITGIMTFNGCSALSDVQWPVSIEKRRAAFRGTPYGDALDKGDWRKSGLCPNCGGLGDESGKCVECGRQFICQNCGGHSIYMGKCIDCGKSV